MIDVYENGLEIISNKDFDLSKSTNIHELKSENMVLKGSLAIAAVILVLLTLYVIKHEESKKDLK